MMLDQDQLEAMLNRSLTEGETSNLDLYLEISLDRLEQLLCLTIDVPAVTETREYDGREDYRTLYLDPFTALTNVTIDGETVAAEDYRVLEKDWAIEFDEPMDGQRVSVTATWGFETLPNSLGLLLAKLFALNGSEQTASSNVKSKLIEGFSVTYNGNTVYDQFLLDNSAAINRYRRCSHGSIRHGRVYPVYD